MLSSAFLASASLWAGRRGWAGPGTPGGRDVGARLQAPVGRAVWGLPVQSRPEEAAAVSTAGRGAQSCPGPGRAVWGWGPQGGTGQGEAGRQTGSREACQPPKEPPAAPSCSAPLRAGGLSSCARLSIVGKPSPPQACLLLWVRGWPSMAPWLPGALALSCGWSLASWPLGGRKWALPSSSVLPQSIGAHPARPHGAGRCLSQAARGPAILGCGADTTWPKNLLHACPVPSLLRPGLSPAALCACVCETPTQVERPPPPGWPKQASADPRVPWQGPWSAAEPVRTVCTVRPALQPCLGAAASAVPPTQVSPLWAPPGGEKPDWRSLGPPPELAAPSDQEYASPPRAAPGGQSTSIPGFANSQGRHISKSPGSQVRKQRTGKSLQEGCQHWGPPTVIRDPLCLHPRSRYTPDLSSQGGPCSLSGWAPLMRLGRETWGNREGFLEEGVGAGREGRQG